MATQTFTVPSQQYTAGVHPFGPFTINAGVSTIQLSLLRSAWPDSGGAEIISIEAVASFDGGQTWNGVLGVNPPYQFGAAGGVLPNDKFGQPQNSNIYTTPIKPDGTPLAAAAQIKGRVVFQQVLTTTITVALS